MTTLTSTIAHPDPPDPADGSGDPEALPTRWKFRPHDRHQILALSRASGLDPLVAQLLVNRGQVEPEAATRFLNPSLSQLHDPVTIPGLVTAAERIQRAVLDRERVVIYGDYDVDGVCGSSLLWACLRSAGLETVRYYIPNRIDEGYGLNVQALEQIRFEMRADLVVTVDCGITSIVEAERAAELGLDLIITDHHTPGSTLPTAFAVVHPGLAHSRYPWPHLCGAGVAFKLAWEVCRRLNDGRHATPRLKQFLCHAITQVALATIADMVPLADENRILVWYGLQGLYEDHAVGLRALCDVAEVKRDRRVSTGAVGFKLAPRINAAGRLDDARLAVELLTTDRDDRARELSDRLDQINRQRQQVERTIVEQARAQIEAMGGVSGRGSIVVSDPTWHPGVIGIVAGRLAETYQRPAVVIAEQDESFAQGSARSVDGFDVHRAIIDCADLLDRFGGHRAAAGIRLTPDRIDAFRERFEIYCQRELTSEQRRRTLWIDAEVHLGQLDHRIVTQIEKLEPFGLTNPKPNLLTDRVRLAADPRFVGKAQEHVQLRLAQGEVILPGIAFQMAEKFRQVQAGDQLAIVYQPGFTRGKVRVEVLLEIRDVHLYEKSA